MQRFLARIEMEARGGGGFFDLEIADLLIWVIRILQLTINTPAGMDSRVGLCWLIRCSCSKKKLEIED